ncbi:MAG: PAS domain-containing protein, partial [Bacteroidetes bacterium]|nr:PAS domain-containing protein [Bacteroidota bacterium]
MDITLKIILFFLGGIAYFLATRASKVEHALLPAVRAFGFTCVLLAFSETIGETPFYLRTFAILLLATVGIVRSAAVLAMQHRSGYRAGKKAAALLATQIALGIAVIIGATVAAGDGAQAQISSQQNLFSSLILIVVILFIAISAILFFRPARDFSKLSAPEFAVTIVNLVALGMLVGPQVNILAIAGIFLVAYLFTFGKRNTPQPASIPLERKKIIDIMRLGWMILDEKNNILDVNPFIEVITGQSSAVLRGKSAHDILTNDEMLAQENQMSEYSVLARVDFDGFVYSFDVRSIPLLKENGDLGGRLLLWQDVTEQKKMEESRQRALETRINLMRSISTAANHITDINIFLEAAIFQIVSSFNGLAGFVFTRDSDFIGDEKAGFKLDAAYSYDEALETQRISENFGRYLARLKAGSHCMHFTEISVPELLENSRYE